MVGFYGPGNETLGVIKASNSLNRRLAADCFQRKDYKTAFVRHIIGSMSQFLPVLNES